MKGRGRRELDRYISSGDRNELDGCKVGWEIAMGDGGNALGGRLD